MSRCPDSNVMHSTTLPLLRLFIPMALSITAILADRRLPTDAECSSAYYRLGQDAMCVQQLSLPDPISYLISASPGERS